MVASAHTVLAVRRTLSPDQVVCGAPSCVVFAPHCTGSPLPAGDLPGGGISAGADYQAFCQRRSAGHRLINQPPLRFDGKIATSPSPGAWYVRQLPRAPVPVDVGNDRKHPDVTSELRGLACPPVSEATGYGNLVLFTPGVRAPARRQVAGTCSTATARMLSRPIRRIGPLLGGGEAERAIGSYQVSMGAVASS